MDLKLKNYFPLLISLSLIVELVAGLTLFPNQITVLYNVFLFSYALIFAKFTGFDVLRYVKWVSLPIIYAISFIIISYYGVNYEFSVKYHVLYLPLGVIEFSIWYFLGRFYDVKVFLKTFYRTVSYYGIGILFLAMVGLVDPEQTRVISGVDLPLAMPITVLFGDIFFSGIIFVLAVFSIKKTVVIGVVFGYLLVKYYQKKYKLDSFNVVVRMTSSKKMATMSKPIRILLLVLLSTMLIAIFFPFLTATIERFAVNTDVIRMAIALEFFNQLFQHFPNGTGFYTFGFLSSDVIDYWSMAANGDIITDGVSLHNSLMHFALEGGIVILIIVFIFYRAYFKAIKFLLKYPESKYIGVIFICWFFVTTFYGMFQQYHATRYFFGIFGLALGVYERIYRRKKFNY